MTSLCTSWLFWFAVLTSGTALVVSAFFWGWSLGVRNNNFKWAMKVKSLYEKWERESKGEEEVIRTPRCDYAPDDGPPHPGEAFHEECGDR